MTDTENDRAQYRSWWTACDDCLVSIRLEAHPEYPQDEGIPDPDEWDSHGDCPVCGATLGWNADPRASWEVTS